MEWRLWPWWNNSVPCRTSNRPTRPATSVSAMPESGGLFHAPNRQRSNAGNDPVAVIGLQRGGSATRRLEKPLISLEYGAGFEPATRGL